MEKQSVTSGAPWESKVGYCRAVRKGPFVEVAGTTAIQNGELAGKGDAFLQTKIVIGIMKKAIEELGGKLEDVVRTRIFVTNIEDFEQVGKAHGQYFSDIKPACTLVEVSALVDPEMLVEMEMTAIISE
ncbi:MAG: RidA family protein [Saprospiraceae bacterium]|nr:RidA family protein [Saprospiraceae bacterium]